MKRKITFVYSREVDLDGLYRIVEFAELGIHDVELEHKIEVVFRVYGTEEENAIYQRQLDRYLSNGKGCAK